MFPIRACCTSGMPWTRHDLGGAIHPLAVATLTGQLSAETLRVLSDEASGPVGRMLGIPKDGNDERSNLKDRYRQTPR